MTDSPSSSSSDRAPTHEIPLKTPPLDGLLPEPPKPKKFKIWRTLLKLGFFVFIPVALIGILWVIPERQLPDPPGGALVDLIEPGSIWHFLDDDTDPGELWYQPDFDHSSWSTGNGLFGYGKGDETTTIRCRPEWPVGEPCDKGGAPDRILTYYFRHVFHVSDPADFERARISMIKDDGAMVYLNGERIIRANMGLGVVGHNKPAAEETEHPRDWFDYHLDLRKLQAGPNTIAVALHQADRGGPAVAFDLKAVAFDLQARAMVRGPYLQSATPNSMVIRWRTADRVATSLRWGQDAENLQVLSGGETPVQDHRIRLTELEPGTDYRYQLGSPEQRLGDDEIYTFSTAPEKGSEDPLSIWVVGDQGTGDSLARKVKLAYLEHVRKQGRSGPDVWLTLGDNAYDDGTDEEFRRALFETYGELLPEHVMWPSVGNHDLKSVKDGKGPYFQIFELPKEGEAGGEASGTESYYSFDPGSVHFISLDTSAGDMRPGREMLTWLEKDLEKNIQPWVIAYFHHPPYTDGWHKSDDPKKGWRMTAVRENVLPILEKAGADLVLAGHSHSYERTPLLHGHYDVSSTLTDAMKKDAGDGDPNGDGAYVKRPDGPGTVYVVAGSSGKLAAGSLEHPAMIRSDQRLGSLVIDVDGDRLDSYFLTDDGEILDHFRIVHR